MDRPAGPEGPARAGHGGAGRTSRAGPVRNRPGGPGRTRRWWRTWLYRTWLALPLGEASQYYRGTSPAIRSGRTGLHMSYPRSMAALVPALARKALGGGRSAIGRLVADQPAVRGT